ncbi:MAG TPA: toluene-4-monooxygenase system B family protein [Steroidobacteraceae bacterium]|nr:toluene-4-monooxygenase system B family protein [Steroidobacteraceae bacterium]
MEQFALVCSFEGDYGLKVLFVRPSATMAEIAHTAADALAGVVVPELAPNEVLRVRRAGAEAFLRPDLTLQEAGFIEMETIEILRQPMATAVDATRG